MSKFKGIFSVGLLVILTGCSPRIDVGAFQDNLKQGNLDQIKESLEIALKNVEVLDELQGYMFEYYNDQANQAWEDYNEGKIGSDEVLEVLEIYNQLDTSKELEVTLEDLEALEESKKNFKLASELVVQQDWKNAFLKFENVIKSDTNYEVAQEKAIKCKDRFYEIKQKEINDYLLEDKLLEAERVVEILNENIKGKHSADLMLETKSQIEAKLKEMENQFETVVQHGNTRVAKRALERYEKYTGERLTKEKEIIRLVELANDLSVMKDMQRAVSQLWYQPGESRESYAMRLMFGEGGHWLTYNGIYTNIMGDTNTSEIDNFLTCLTQSQEFYLQDKTYEEYTDQMSDEFTEDFYNEYLSMYRRINNIIDEIVLTYKEIGDYVSKQDQIDEKVLPLIKQAQELLPRGKQLYEKINRMVAAYEKEYTDLYNKLHIEYQAPIVLVSERNEW